MPSPSGVQFDLDTSRTLRLTNWALVRLEDVTGENVFWHLRQALTGSIRSRARLVWAASLHADPGLDPDDVVDWLDMTRQRELTDALAELVNETFGVDNLENGADPEGKAEAATDG